MKFSLLKFVFFTLVIGLIVVPKAEARRWSHWYTPTFDFSQWHGGYWYHGAYAGHAGWWWIVGPSWYFYSQPMYPYPPVETAPEYFTTVGGTPPPETAPGTAVAGQTADASQLMPVAGSVTADPQLPGQPQVAGQQVPSATPPAKNNLPQNQNTISYYCDKAHAYYPQVQQCPDGWIAVPVGQSQPLLQEVRQWPERHYYNVESPELVHAQPNVVTFEFFGRALIYSVNYDRALTDHISLGVGFSSWESRDWWTGVDSTITVVPVYLDYYFSDRLGRGYLSAGADFISVTKPTAVDSPFSESNTAGVIGGGYETREPSGYILRFGGYAIIGKTTTVNPSVSVGYAF